MFNLDRHIEILLLKHDCVILPGFGGFVAHHACAQLDATDGVMLPPKTIVGFNPQLTVNDSLLVQSYVEAYDYSFPEAQRIVEEQISELARMIEEYGLFEIHSVGELRLNENGNYEFTPTDSGILAPGYYALPGIDTTDSEYFIGKANNEAEAEETLNATGSTEEDDEKYIKISIASLRRFATACAILAFIVALPFIGQNPNTKAILSSINTSFIYNLMPKGETKTVEPEHKTVVHIQKPAPKKVVVKVEKKVEETVEQKKEEEANINETIPEPAYAVVLASRISEQNAAEHVKKLHDKGMTEARVVGEGKSRKIVFGNYPTEEEAQQAKRNLSMQEEFSGVWVTKI